MSVDKEENINMMSPIPKNTVLIVLRHGNVGSSYGVYKNRKLYTLEPVINKSCNCTVAYKLEEVKLGELKQLLHPAKREVLNEIFEDYLN